MFSIGEAHQLWWQFGGVGILGPTGSNTAPTYWDLDPRFSLPFFNIVFSATTVFFSLTLKLVEEDEKFTLMLMLSLVDVSLALLNFTTG